MTRHLWAYTASYEDSFTFLFIDCVRTSRETYLWISTACYAHNFIFVCMLMAFVPHRTHFYGSPQLVTEIALLVYYLGADVYILVVSEERRHRVDDYI
jgi:hypothetical protein